MGRAGEFQPKIKKQEKRPFVPGVTLLYTDLTPEELAGCHRHGDAGQVGAHGRQASRRDASLRHGKGAYTHVCFRANVS